MTERGVTANIQSYRTTFGEFMWFILLEIIGLNAKIIDWKKLSKTDGYRRLKASFLSSPSCEPFYKNKWVYIFGLLKKICYKHNLDPCKVLEAWEKDRTYSHANYYQKCYENILIKLALTTIN